MARTPEHRKRCSRGNKIKFRTARAAIGWARMNHHSQPYGAAFTYLCPACGFVHLTTRPQPGQRPLEAA